MKKKGILVSLSICLMAIFIFSFIFFRNHNYVIVHPEKSDINEAVYGLGKVKSKNRFEVIVGIMSTVTKRYVNEGDQVEKGTRLIQFNEQTLFKSPFKGTVTYANLYEGETAIPNIPVMRVEDLNQKYIELSLEQQSILRVQLNQVARISFETLRGKILLGRVSAIFPREQEFIVNIDVENLDGNILPGMTADVTIEIGSIKNATILPLAAIKNGMLLLKRKGHWEAVKVDVGQIDGLSAEIKNPQLSTEDSVRVKKDSR